MSRETPRAILRKDRALILVSQPLYVAISDTTNTTPMSVELHLSREDYDALARQMPGEVHDFLTWIISLDDPDPASEGFQSRRVTTMTDIIRRAREAMQIGEDRP